MNKAIVSARLKALRGEENREVTAAKYGVSVSALHMYERGERVPRDETKEKIAECYGKSVQEIFFDP